MRILIVEDEVKIREGMAKLITEHTEHTVIGEAVNGQEGLNMAIRFKPDLVITDIHMPVMDGLEMIKGLYEVNLNIHIVILSGYSEFEYAKKAIRYNVDDYLLKPLTVSDIVEVLDRIENKILLEEKNIETADRYISEIIFNGIIPETNRNHLEEICGFADDRCYHLYYAYTGEISVQNEEELKEKFLTLAEQYEDVILYAFQRKTGRQMGCLAVLPTDQRVQNEFRRSFERRLVKPYKHREEKAAWAWMCFDSYEEMTQAEKKMEKLIKASIGIPKGGLATQECIEQLLWKEFSFPTSLNNDMKNAICKGQLNAVTELGESFIRYMQDGPYQEQDIRQAYIKTCYMLLDTIREIDVHVCEQLQDADLLGCIAQVMTRREIEQSYRAGLKILVNTPKEKEDISNYTIKKAINYIREHYQEGITQEDVAGCLGITPEYLSTLFNREMKINFSTFLRQFRISHAKRLLRGSEMKVYEIANKVGYSDPKYFARVFKDEEGISPGDYRNMN